jgi:uncharacterized protein YecE (DUF72 family)
MHSMNDQAKYIIGTSGYSFKDWVGVFYPDGTQGRDMLSCYVQHFETVELNFSYYRMPSAATLDAMAAKTPDGFTFWIKANQETTHKGNRAVAGEFLESLGPMISRDKLAGVLMQFPQSFHRTVANRKYLAATLGDFSAVPIAVEFRHRSWLAPETNDGLRRRNVTLVIPDVPELDGLYHSGPAVTSSTGYLRLHSRNAAKWYAGGPERYDWNYTTKEIEELIGRWSDAAGQVDKVYTFFNNCHKGQAAKNAEAMRQILEQI